MSIKAYLTPAFKASVTPVFVTNRKLAGLGVFPDIKVENPFGFKFIGKGHLDDATAKADAKKNSERAQQYFDGLKEAIKANLPGIAGTFPGLGLALGCRDIHGGAAQALHDSTAKLGIPTIEKAFVLDAKISGKNNELLQIDNEVLMLFLGKDKDGEPVVCLTEKKKNTRNPSDGRGGYSSEIIPFTNKTGFKSPASDFHLNGIMARGLFYQDSMMLDGGGFAREGEIGKVLKSYSVRRLKNREVSLENAKAGGIVAINGKEKTVILLAAVEDGKDGFRIYATDKRVRPGLDNAFEKFEPVKPDVVQKLTIVPGGLEMFCNGFAAPRSRYILFRLSRDGDGTARKLELLEFKYPPAVESLGEKEKTLQVA